MTRLTVPMLVLATTVLCLAWAGCGDDGTKSPPAPGSVEGTLTEVNSGTPVGDATVMLIDVLELTVASEIVGTDNAGHYRIDGIAPGSYAVLVFHDSLAVREKPAPQVRVSPNKVTTFDINLVDIEFSGPGGYHIEGTVIDAQTLEPVPGAFVGQALLLQGELEGFAEGVAFLSAVTDSFGSFSVPALDLEFAFESGLAPITVTKEGYEPYTLIGEGPSIPGVLPPLLPFPPGDGLTLAVDISLEPLSPDGTGSHGAGAIKGRLMSFGQPVADVLVGASISAVSDPDTFRTPPVSPVPVPEGVARTDAQGRFLLEGLTPGQYWVDPAFLDNDGYVKGTFGDPLAFMCTVVDSGTCDLGVLEIGRAITPVSPQNRSTVQDTTPEFRWSPISIPPGYDFLGYEVGYGVGYLLMDSGGLLQEPRWQVPVSKVFSPGDNVRWHVSAVAYDPSSQREVEIAAFEWPVTFSVAD